jgi:hypothetical protein
MRLYGDPLLDDDDDDDDTDEDSFLLGDDEDDYCDDDDWCGTMPPLPMLFSYWQMGGFS